MKKKNSKLPKAKVIVSDELPFEYDPNDKGAMEKLAHANKIGLGRVIREEDDDNQPKAKRTKSLKKRSK